MNYITTRISIFFRLAILLILTSCTISVAKSVDKNERPVMNIVKDGKPMATIITSSKSKQTSDAVRDLQLYIEKMSGAKLPIASSLETPGNLILVGRIPEVDKLIPDLDEYDLGPDGIVIRQLPGKLILVGKSDGYIHDDLGRFRGPTDCGTPNAVYYFLESLGCRWYMPGEDGEVVPHRPTITISGVDIISKPDFVGRWIGIWTRKGKGYEDFLTWQARNRISHNTYFHMHIIPALLSKEKYFQSHPEYFALVKGKRQEHGEAQLCMSNPEVTEIVSKAIIDIMTMYQHQPRMRSYSLGQADGPSDGWCKCDKCLAMYGDKMPYNVANGYLKFVNAVAERVEKINPDALFTYYAHYNIPGFPEVKPRASVLPIICHIKPHNELWRKQVLNWENISKHLYYYAYMGWRIDFPKLSIAEDIRWCHEHKGIAMYLEHNTYSPINMVALYLAGKALWDTNIDSPKILSEFYKSYYGEAEEPMRKFYETFHRLTREYISNSDSGWFYAYPDILTTKAAAGCRGYLTEALGRAKHLVVRRRIESVSRYWRATELHVKAQEDLADWKKDKTKEKEKVTRKTLKDTIDYINSLKDEFALGVRIALLNHMLKELNE